MVLRAAFSGGRGVLCGRAPLSKAGSTDLGDAFGVKLIERGFQKAASCHRFFRLLRPRAFPTIARGWNNV